VNTGVWNDARGHGPYWRPAVNTSSVYERHVRKTEDRNITPPFVEIGNKTITAYYVNNNGTYAIWDVWLRATALTCSLLDK